jgi:hypothetical protein
MTSETTHLRRADRMDHPVRAMPAPVLLQAAGQRAEAREAREDNEMSNPLVLLLVWVGSTVLAAALAGWACYVAGYDRCEREQDRHRHRIGAPKVAADLPRSGPLTPLPGPGWSFFGGAQLEVPPGPAEYELLTWQVPPADIARAYADAPWGPAGPLDVLGMITNSSPAAEPCESPGCTIDETPSDFTRRMALDMDEFIAKMEGDTNYLLHVMRAREDTP